MKRLVEAYRHGIFPWFNDGDPVLCGRPIRAPCWRRRACTSRIRCARSEKAGFPHRRRGIWPRARRLCRHARQRFGHWITGHMRRAYTSLHLAGLALHRGLDGRRGPRPLTAWRSDACSSASRCSAADRRLEDRHGRGGRSLAVGRCRCSTASSKRNTCFTRCRAPCRGRQVRARGGATGNEPTCRGNSMTTCEGDAQHSPPRAQNRTWVSPRPQTARSESGRSHRSMTDCPRI